MSHKKLSSADDIPLYPTQTKWSASNRDRNRGHEGWIEFVLKDKLVSVADSDTEFGLNDWSLEINVNWSSFIVQHHLASNYANTIVVNVSLQKKYPLYEL